STQGGDGGRGRQHRHFTRSPLQQRTQRPLALTIDDGDVRLKGASRQLQQGSARLGRRFELQRRGDRCKNSRRRIPFKDVPTVGGDAIFDKGVDRKSTRL